MDGFDWSGHLRFGISLFALADPIGNVPIFLGLTSRLSLRGRMSAATAAAVTMLAVLLIGYYVGEAVMTTLGTSLPSFQIAGGLIIALSGYEMMTEAVLPSADDVESDSGASAIHVGVAPMGIPLLGGPGTMTGVMLEGHTGFGLAHSQLVVAIILAVVVLSWAILASAGAVARLLGRSGMLVFQRLFGLIVIAIGVEIIVGGVLGHVERFVGA